MCTGIISIIIFDIQHKIVICVFFISFIKMKALWSIDAIGIYRTSILVNLKTFAVHGCSKVRSIRSRFYHFLSVKCINTTREIIVGQISNNGKIKCYPSKHSSWLFILIYHKESGLLVKCTFISCIFTVHILVQNLIRNCRTIFSCQKLFKLCRSINW